MEVLKSVASVFTGRCLACNSVVLSLVTLFVLYQRRNIYIILKTLPRDLRLLRRFLYTGYYLTKYKINNDNVISLFRKQVAENPEKAIFCYEDTEWTRKELDEYSDRIAIIFQRQGYEKGDVVALLSFNRPEYVGIWLGLGKIGVVTALINTNLKSQSLAHCVNVANCRAFIFTPEFAKDVNAIRSLLPTDIHYLAYGVAPEFEGPVTNLSEVVASTEKETFDTDIYVEAHDKLLYIYTSGTTGLPKAAIITHRKLAYTGCGIYCIMGWRTSDVIYNPLPLYHTSGGLIGIASTLTFGMTTVLRPKFSASGYFADCIKYKCTVAQYIGEMCRYMLTVPPSPNDTNHSLRMVIGNGLRPDVWKIFIERFKIPLVLELYGSTEGNANIVNNDNTIGAVGFIPRIIPTSLFPISLIRYDESTGEPIRDKNGFCIRCKPGESGMCIGVINRNDPVRDFQGYVDKTETEKKIIANVFKRGDQAFLSGDILYQDEFGYLFFKDRTGDTFRWKGENVSTSEVEIVVSKLINYKDCTVYGVKVGNSEGRAGMLAIADPKNEVDLNALAKGLDDELPVYARPLFVRIVTKLAVTGTYKIQKTDFRNEGIDINVIQDKVYFKDARKGFVPLTRELYNDIMNNIVKV